jgi:hypothetical protein
VSQPAYPVACPRSQTKTRCGNLYPQAAIEGAKWTCTRCRHIWTERDIRALIAARLHRATARTPELGRQLAFGEEES